MVTDLFGCKCILLITFVKKNTGSHDHSMGTHSTIYQELQSYGTLDACENLNHTVPQLMWSAGNQAQAAVFLSWYNHAEMTNKINIKTGSCRNRSWPIKKTCDTPIRSCTAWLCLRSENHKRSSLNKIAWNRMEIATTLMKITIRKQNVFTYFVFII